MPKNSKSRDSYLSCILLIICNRLPANITRLLSNESYSRSRSLSLPSYSSSTPLPLLDNPRYLSPSIPQPNASPHKSNTFKTAAKGFQWISLCLILSSLSIRMTQYMRFYRVPERVRDQIQRKYFCERVFRLHQDTTRRDTLEWMTDSTSYILTDKFCLHLVAQKIYPWSMMSEVWEEEKIAKESSKGRAHHWKWSMWVNLHR